MRNLSTKNNAISVLDKNLISDWNTVINVLDAVHIDKVIHIEGTIAEKYRTDMYGLFKHLELQDEFIYPHIRVNGYNSSSGYMGDKLDIKILKTQILNTYYEMFTR